MLQLRNAKVTITLIVINILWFMVELHNGFTTTGLLQSGAQDYTDVVMGGQWWRVLSSMFVHGGYAHIAINMISLASLGVVEMFTGRLRYLIIYFASGICGNLAEVLLGSHQAVSMGASGAIMGVFGIALLMALHKNLPRGVLYQLLFWLVLNFAIGFSTTGIGNIAHIGGLLTGGIVMELVVYRASRKFWTWLIGLATLLATLGLASTIAYGGTSDTGTSVSRLISDQNKLVLIEQETVNAFNGAGKGSISPASALKTYKREQESLVALLATSESHRQQAPKPLVPVFDKLYQGESAWSKGLALLIQSGGHASSATYSRVTQFFNQSVAADNAMYKLAQPYGVQRAGG
ncbi:rhomboid family intramembrane serine protease [Alicyclobacillus sp. ALC3]|uniref:rhomboid family intramembrane serine protease n=1 Tax=Alicyclobacillus sp. ALC3 TaxID=2796143 RepID=UPI00237842CA|nr:rhomboid family intramembrane serine protease [Alicyclobacillus sp. ALC3]WDL99122.1 rhomboid family intramembrane serine protease [Alicyclobacillus sp. ALC3]